MSASDDLVIEPVVEPAIELTIKEAITRTAGDEVDDLGTTLDNAVNGAYLDWPNEGGVSGTHYYQTETPIYYDALL
jgi:hypothetical protein